MVLRRWTPGCPCCAVWGLEWGPSTGQHLADYWEGPTRNIYQDLNKLQGLRLFMNGFACGRYPGTGDDLWYTVTIPEEDWPTLKAWIEAGGVMMSQMDYFTAGFASQIVDLRNHYNDLFSYLGTDIEILAMNTNFPNEGCDLEHGSIINTAINAPVLENVDKLHNGLPWEGITGGTWLAKWVDEYDNEGILVTAAAVGDGYLFVTSDVNISVGCGSYWDEEQTTNSNYQFFENIFEKDVLL